MIKQICEQSLKWICLLLITYIVVSSLYQWRDTKHEMTRIAANDLAKNLSMFGRLPGVSTPLQQQINQILRTNGFSQYAITISVPADPADPADPVNPAETKPEKREKK